MQRARYHMAMCVALAVLCWSSAGEANMPQPPTGVYDITFADNNVTVCPRVDRYDGGYTAPTCPDQGLLREDVATGEVVRIDSCWAEGDPQHEGCFIDRCVPEGTYRYGLATPFDCSSTKLWSIRLFERFSVVGNPAASCSPTATVYDGALPWAGTTEPRLDCDEYVSDYDGDEGGCALVGTPGVVFGSQALLLLAGLLLLVRRRSRR